MNDKKYPTQEKDYPIYTDVQKHLLAKILRNADTNSTELPTTQFSGYDVTNHYEFAVLRDDGFPVVGVVKIVCEANTEYMAETNAVGRYLHSFNFVRLGKTSELALGNACKIIERDITELLDVTVKVGIFSKKHLPTLPVAYEETYDNIDDIVESMNVTAGEPTGRNSNLLKTKKNYTGGQRLVTHNLRAYCGITRKPDSRAVFIRISGGRSIDELSLLRYFCSMRREYHFTEEIIEILCNDLYDRYQPTELVVITMETQQTGVDANSVRWINGGSEDNSIFDNTILNTPHCNMRYGGLEQ